MRSLQSRLRGTTQSLLLGGGLVCAAVSCAAQTAPQATLNLDASLVGTERAAVSLPGSNFDAVPDAVGESTSAASSDAALPDEPQPSPDLIDTQSGAPADTQQKSFGEILKGSKQATASRTLDAPVYHRYIRPDEIAQQLTPRQRLIFGFAQPLSPFFLLTIASAAGYEQAVNGSPNYGTNFSAYGQRVGAAAIRNASQSIFSDSLMAPLLHEDPRYYILGDRHNAVVRTAYAISRVLVTKKDDGDATPNYALFAGYAGAAGLNNAYYPAANVGFRPTARSFGGSLIGVGLGNIFREFLPDALHAAHLERFD